MTISGLTLLTETDAPERNDCDGHGTDHIMEALKQVSRESGVPIEEFYYKYDRSEDTRMAELNRRAYALAAQAAGVKVLPEYQVSGIPCLVYGPTRKKISHSAAQTLIAALQSLRTLELGTCQEIARHSGLPAVTIKNRVRRLHTMGLIREVSQRESSCAIVWAVTETAFHDVFVVQDAPVPSIGPVSDQAVAA